MVQEKPPISPRIALLEQALLAKNAAMLDTFWQEVAERGAPLIEPIEGIDSADWELKDSMLIPAVHLSCIM